MKWTSARECVRTCVGEREIEMGKELEMKKIHAFIQVNTIFSIQFRKLCK